MAKYIYRIQDKDGRGPWKPGFSTVWVEYREDHDNLIPWHFDFAGINMSNIAKHKAYGCGCTSIKHLKRWFTESEYKTLKKHGYHAIKISKYEIIAESDIQCIFTCKKLLQKMGDRFELY